MGVHRNDKTILIKKCELHYQWVYTGTRKKFNLTFSTTYEVFLYNFSRLQKHRIKKIILNILF